VLEVCTNAEAAPGEVIDLDAIRPQIDRLFADFSGQGLRTLGVAYRDIGSETGIHKGHEAGMTFLGLLILEDPLRVGIVETLQKLLDLGIATKLITGDNRLVAAHVARQAGLPETKVLTGSDLRQISDDALTRQVDEVSVFAEIEPNQKERIILALKKAGLVVGYMGDGINDASALHAADVGISVADAVDVAKEAADFVLLEKDLGVLERGVREGRATFANTMKYVFMATSANFGNMFSMAGASLFLAYLPLLPKQVLLMNLLTDLPEMTIATDLVDPEMVERPRHWEIGFIRRFMVVFGVISSVFDFLTFGVLILVLHAEESELRTGWFVESVVSSALIVLVVRTRRPFYRSRPARPLFMATLAVVGLTILLPYSPLASLLGLVPLPLAFLVALGPIVLLYLIAAEAAKSVFYRRENGRKDSDQSVISTRPIGVPR
jgi:P-type Mg2+ transporter